MQAKTFEKMTEGNDILIIIKDISAFGFNRLGDNSLESLHSVKIGPFGVGVSLE